MLLYAIVVLPYICENIIYLTTYSNCMKVYKKVKIFFILYKNLFL